MRYPPFIAFDLASVCGSTQQVKCIAGIYIPNLDLLCNGIIKWDTHAQAFVAESIWILYMISKETALEICIRNKDAENIYIPRPLFLDIENVLMQMIADSSIENYDDITNETIEVVLRSKSKNDTFTDSELNEVQIITVH